MGNLEGFNVRERNPASGAITENFIISKLGLNAVPVLFHAVAEGSRVARFGGKVPGLLFAAVGAVKFGKFGFGALHFLILGYF